MAAIEIVGLERTLQHPEHEREANLAVVRDGDARIVHVLRAPDGWLVQTNAGDGEPVATDTCVGGSLTDATLYGIGVALERPVSSELTSRP